MADDDSDDRGDEAHGPDLADGIALDALEPGQPFAGTFGGEPLVVVGDGDRWCAFSGKCTHLDAPLADGIVVDGTLRCPWHHARFSIATGEAVAAPAFAPLRRFDVEVRDGRLRVTGPAAAAARATPAHRPPERIVIVGAGAAGHACAELLARDGYGGRVTVVGADRDPPYDRTFCSKQYLIGMKSRDASFLADTAFDGTDGPTLLLDREVVSIDLSGRTVRLADDTLVGFDALVLATGAEPARPDLPGFDRENVHVLRSLADADAIIAAAKTATRVAIVGASFIGLEAAASLRQRHLEVDVVAPDRIPLEKIVGAEVGAMIRRVHEEKGVRFHLGREVRGFDGRRLSLDDGSTIDADFVVVGAGVAPRTGLAAAAGLALASKDDGGGIVVDEHLETSVLGIFAIGDVASYPDRHARRRVRIEHWVHAQRQGQYVARRLIGEAADGFDDLPFFWSAHFDTGLRYLGHLDAIRSQAVDGSIDGRDFTIRYVGTGGTEAFATCNRDLPALREEAAREQA